MASNAKTVKKMELAQKLFTEGKNFQEIADALAKDGLVNEKTKQPLSTKRVEELIEGINKNRATGEKKKIS